MKRSNLVLLLLLSFTFFSCKESLKPKHVSIIPEPEHLTVYTGSFELNENTRILVSNPDKLKFESQYLADIIRKHTGHKPEIIFYSKNENSKNAILLRLSPKASDNSEGYQLKADKKNITILAPTSKGIFYGIQSLLQLLSPSFFASVHQEKWEIPQCFIQDAPRFPYRGMLLDVSRHFFPPADIKRYIDMLAMYKYQYSGKFLNSTIIQNITP